MQLEQLIDQLDKLLLSQSTDFAEMRRILHEIQKTRDVYRWMDSAQDRLYASIASGHLKVLQHLEEGQLKNAKKEAAAAVAWFYLRFQACEHDTNDRIPQISEVFHRVAQVAEHSPALREALQKPREAIASEFSPGGRK
jgi:hypothetical protein